MKLKSGTLRFENSNSYTDTYRFTDGDISLIVSIKPGHEDTVPNVLDNLPRWDAMARDKLAEAYSKIYNESWRELDEPSLDEVAFRQALTIESVGVCDARFGPGHFSLQYGDAGLFDGHGFFVSFTDAGDIRGEEMFG
ncbi:hypothetical protein [Yoonia sp. 2307UL14-13]|uniref:hypothetical protein n=1 Tax=Yoonia sp. 2307UL14-13 TaxID=3126506 RepID=UPI0030AA09ED